MSNSYKKTPKHWVCSKRSGEMKSWKTRMNRKFRRQSSLEYGLNNCTYRKFTGDLWDSPSDGKCFIKDKKLMRK